MQSLCKVIMHSLGKQWFYCDHLRAEYGDGIANWCKTFWSDARGRMCLAHSWYAACNNNMGVEVSWRDIKKLLPANCTLLQFLGVLYHYIRTYLGEEHMQRLLDMGGNGNAFISTPIPTKEMWDGVQSAHIKTLSCCFVIESSSKQANVPILFRDMMEEVMEIGPVSMPLHLRIAAWHDDQLRSGSGTHLGIGEIKPVLVPRQAP
jgi:hypothetical protein